VTNSPRLGLISDMLRATNHAGGITVCNRDRESGFRKLLFTTTRRKHNSALVDSSGIVPFEFLTGLAAAFGPKRVFSSESESVEWVMKLISKRKGIVP
jgi:hypothetical protein